MKRLGFKIIGILVISIVLLQGSVAIAVSSEETKLKNEQNAINNEKKEAEKDLEEIKAKKSETMKQVEELASQIVNYQSQIETLDTEISEMNTKIKESEEKLKQAEEDYTKQKALLEARLVATYEAGETSYLDFILSSSSITDLISNYYLITEIATNDAELLESIEKQKQEIEKAKQELEQSKQGLVTSKASKQSISTQLKNARDEKNIQAAKLSKEEKEIQEHIEELQTASRQIEKDIKAAQERYKAEIEALNKENSNTISGGKGILQRPVSTGTITATMYYSNGSYHGALDYGVSIGTPVYSAANGVVIKTANLTTSYGTYVVIQHANGLQTWYAHGTSGSICVSPGQTVSRGQQIMKSGNSGKSFGPHLHFEVRVAPYDYGSCRVDPRNYF